MAITIPAPPVEARHPIRHWHDSAFVAGSQRELVLHVQTHLEVAHRVVVEVPYDTVPLDEESLIDVHVALHRSDEWRGFMESPV